MAIEKMEEYRKFNKSDIVKFKRNLTRNNKNARVIREMDSDEYLKACKICYKAIYLSQWYRGLSDEQMYLKGRLLGYKKLDKGFIETDASTILLRQEYKNKADFNSFVVNNWGYPFHSFEIIYGKLIMACKFSDNHYYFELYTHYSWDEEAMEMLIKAYNALVEEELPVNVIIPEEMHNTILKD